MDNANLHGSIAVSRDDGSSWAARMGERDRKRSAADKERCSERVLDAEEANLP